MKPMNKIDKMLALVLAVTIIFIAVMVWLFNRYQSVPDSLVVGFFGLVGGECGVLGWIKSNKERKRERRYEIEDRKYKNKQDKKEDEHEDIDAAG